MRLAGHAKHIRAKHIRAMSGVRIMLEGFLICVVAIFGDFIFDHPDFKLALGIKVMRILGLYFIIKGYIISKKELSL